ncbi:hypothetical protein AYK26_00760 [Euryarchaeota archaeon SM23-78]|nr:MAG: hypothetical protein AYK26_00760 [Euryarchaeota archaeon SM23-78]
MWWNLLISPVLGIGCVLLNLLEEKVQFAAVGIVIFFTNWAFRGVGHFFEGLLFGAVFIAVCVGTQALKSGQTQKAPAKSQKKT